MSNIEHRTPYPINNSCAAFATTVPGPKMAAAPGNPKTGLGPRFYFQFPESGRVRYPASEVFER